MYQFPSINFTISGLGRRKSVLKIHAQTWDRVGLCLACEQAGNIELDRKLQYVETLLSKEHMPHFTYFWRKVFLQLPEYDVFPRQYLEECRPHTHTSHFESS